MIGILGKGCSVFRPVGSYSRFWSFRVSPDGPCGSTCACPCVFLLPDRPHTVRATHTKHAAQTRPLHIVTRLLADKPPFPAHPPHAGALGAWGAGSPGFPVFFSLAFQTLPLEFALLLLADAHRAALGGELPPGRRLPGDAVCEGSTAGARAHVRPTDFRSTCRTACTRTDRDEDLR